MGGGGFPSEAEGLKKIKRNERFSFKVGFYFHFFAGLPKSQNYEIAPQIPEK